MYLCTSEYQTDTHSAFKYVLFTFSVLFLYEKKTHFISVDMNNHVSKGPSLVLSVSSNILE